MSWCTLLSTAAGSSTHIYVVPEPLPRRWCCGWAEVPLHIMCSAPWHISSQSQGSAWDCTRHHHSAAMAEGEHTQVLFALAGHDGRTMPLCPFCYNNPLQGAHQVSPLSQLSLLHACFK